MTKRTPHFKSKATKDKENYDVSETTSQDVVYMTESNYNRRFYSNRDERRNDGFSTSGTYESRYFEKYTSRGSKEESPVYDEYTTSSVSYRENKRQSNDFKYPMSISEYSYKEYPKRHNQKRYSPTRDYDYSDHKDSERRRRLTRSRSPRERYQYGSKDGRYRDIQRIYWSPKREKDYQDYISDEVEDDFGSNKYFERTRLREKRPEMHGKGFSDFGERKNHPVPPNRGKNYQVYAYPETKQYKGVFESKRNVSKGPPVDAETELKSHEYPVLAYKDIAASEYDKIYLPVIVLGKPETSNTQTVSATKTTPIQRENIQVLIANLQEQENIFKQNPSQNVIDNTIKQSSADFWYASSLLASQMLRGSNLEQQIETSSNSKQPGIGSQVENPLTKETQNNAQFEVSSKGEQSNNVSDYRSKRSSDIKHAGSLVESIINREISPMPTKKDISHETNASKTTYYQPVNDSVNHQTIVNVGSQTRNMYKSLTLKEEPIHSNDEISYQQIGNILQDNYPVTKDYINVHDNISEQMRVLSPTSSNKNKSSDQRSSFKTHKTTTTEPDRQKYQTPDRSVLTENQSMLDKYSMVVEEKPGSMSITTYFQPDLQVQVKGTIKNKRLSTVQEESDHKQFKEKRNTNLDTRSKVTSCKTIRDVESTASHVPFKTVAVSRVSEARSRQSIIPRSISQVNVIQEENSQNKTASVVSKVPLKQGMAGASLESSSIKNKSGETGRTQSVSKMSLQQRVGNISKESSKQSDKEVCDSDGVGTRLTEGSSLQQKQSKENRSLVNPGTTKVGSTPSTLEEPTKPTMGTSFKSMQITNSSLYRKPYVPSKNSAYKRSTGKNSLQDNDEGDNNSIFIQSIEPLSTQFKNEQMLRNSTNKSSITKDSGKRMSNTNLRPQNISENPSTSLFSKYSTSKSNLKRNKSNTDKSQSKISLNRSCSNIILRGTGILKQMSKTAIKQRSTTSLAQQQPPSEGSQEEEKMTKGETKGKICDCFEKYIKQTRQCGRFFLGTNLHEQVMSFLNIILRDSHAPGK